ncbi:MAG: beta strand repeat-containing protein, partial [Synechococcus sp.]
SGAAETTGVANPGKFTLARSGSTTAALTVNIGMTGSATNGTDYTLIPTTVTFAAGAATADVNLTVTDDAIVEGSETAVLTVAAGAGYTVGAGASATVTIADNDLPVVTVIATDPTAAETAGAPDPGVFTLSRSGPTTNSLTVAVAMSGTSTNGADYTTIPATATFAAGSATAVVNVAVIDDLLIEGATPETAILTIQSGLTYVVGAASSATVTITDNDLPVITVSATDALAEETSGAPNPGSFTLTRTGPTTDALTVAVAMSGSATNGVDYTTVPTTATFAAGSPTALVNINVIDDSIIEGPTPETAVLTVNPGSGYTVGAPANATVSIADNDFIPVSLSSNYSGVSENSKENLVYKVSRTVGLADTLTINLTLGGTAVRPSDYNAYGLTILTPTTATLSLAAGAASAEFELVTKGDLVKENNETIDITLAAGIGYLIGTPGSVQTTIINDDGVLNQIGTSGKDFIEAGSTKNLSGGAGDDVLIGSAAGNVLSGGTGNDLVTTGAGFDVITFGSASEGIDTVTDFNVLYDTLQVSAAGFGGGLTPGQSIDASQFTLGSSATNANHRFIYNALDGKLYFDSDGNGAISSVLFAQLATGLALNEDNIFAA